MEQEKIIYTIKKVLELSKNNPSEEEAKSAALKAQELLAKYHISMADVEDIDISKAEMIEEVRVDVPSKKWKYQLATIVSDNFCCKHFFYGKGTIVFYGHKTDANVAAEIFKYLFLTGDKCACKVAIKALREDGTSAGVYNSFLTGFLAGIKEVLSEQCRALMLVVPQDVIDSFNDKTKGFKTIKTRGPSVRFNSSCNNAFHEGFQTGRHTMNSRLLEG